MRHAIHLLALVPPLVAAGMSWRAERRHELERAARADAWADAAARMDARRAGAAEPGGPPLLAGFPDLETWRAGAADPLAIRSCRAASLSFPPVDPDRGLALVAALGTRAFLGSVPEPGIHAVAWAAGREPESLRPEQILVLGAGTATLLGSPWIAGRQGPREDALRSVAGLERLRVALEGRCGGCAPASAPLPPPPPEDGPVAASIAAERIRRCGVEAPDLAAPLGAIGAVIRGGGEPPPSAWKLAGAAGWSALELGRAGRADHLPDIFGAALDAPSATDRLAALYAARRLAGGTSGLAAAGAPPGVLARARALGW